MATLEPGKEEIVYYFIDDLYYCQYHGVFYALHDDGQWHQLDPHPLLFRKEAKIHQYAARVNYQELLTVCQKDNIPNPPPLPIISSHQ